MSTISATDAARKFSDLLNRVRYQGATFDITRGGEVVARIVPAVPALTVRIEEFDQLLAAVPRLDPEDAARFEDDLAAIRRDAKLPEPKWD